ncbi:uncharacterized protein LOC126704890 [Quercus robur]|nr:uncharacterized protein LOC126704890 [Quercus robur]
MESDDEWITEKEEPCLPEDTSWMDIHECFEVNEEGCSRKRKRGPRNLNAKKKSKEKVIEVEEPEEIVDVGDDEEDVQEDANDEMILQDDEDDNFIDLDYGDDFDDFD